MSTSSQKRSRQDELRSRAVAQLKGPGAQVRGDAAAALAVLYELASTPATASDALALLHELQVHQVEVDLQDEELRCARHELETALDRQVQLYDHCPFGQFTVDDNLVVRELNRSGAILLGVEGAALRGQSFENLLTPAGQSALRTMLGHVVKGANTVFAELQMSCADGETRRAYASACLDPAGGGFLIGLMGAIETTSVA